MDLRGTDLVVTPSEIVNFDKATPTTVGVVFDPNTPATTDVLYVSSVDASTWIYNGTSYVTYNKEVPSSTPFYLTGTTIDAGANKTAPIHHNGYLRANRFEVGTSYIFTTSAPSPGKVLGYGGVGLASWVDSAGGLTYFTEAQNGSTPNATVKVDSLTAIGSTSDVDIAIVPKGMGSFLLAVPDNTTAGGNKRGLYSVDLQTAPRGTADQVCSGNYAMLLGGYRSKVNADHAIGGGNQNVASGLYSLALGGQGNTASGSFSVVFGSSNTASNTGSMAFGYGNTTSGAFYSACIGYSNTASANGTFAIGIANISSGPYSFTFGYGCESTVEYSVSLGLYSKSFGTQGKLSHSGGRFSSTGDSQIGWLPLRVRTTNATTTPLTTDGGAYSAGNAYVLQNNQLITFKGQIQGKKTGTTEVGVWDIDGVIVRGANAGTTTLTISNVTLVTNASGWGTPTLSADTTNGALKVEVAGLSATNIQWGCRIDTVETIY